MSSRLPPEGGGAEERGCAAGLAVLEAFSNLRILSRSAPFDLCTRLAIANVRAVGFCFQSELPSAGKWASINRFNLAPFTPLTRCGYVVEG